VVLARRRPLAAAAAGLSVLVGVQATAPPPPPTHSVVTAARDLPAGTVLAPRDLKRTPFSPQSVPAGAVVVAREVVGRTTTGPIRTREAITDVRLVDDPLLDGYPGRVAAPVRIGDAGAVSLLRVGDLVDIIAADPQGRSEATFVAEAAPVLALPRAPGTGPVSGGLVVLAVPEQTAKDLAAAAVSRYLSVVIAR
jgi:Flp pilus assembly protein CpaB